MLLTLACKRKCEVSIERESLDALIRWTLCRKVFGREILQNQKPGTLLFFQPQLYTLGALSSFLTSSAAFALTNVFRLDHVDHDRVIEGGRRLPVTLLLYYLSFYLLGSDHCIIVKQTDATENNFFLYFHLLGICLCFIAGSVAWQLRLQLIGSFCFGGLPVFHDVQKSLAPCRENWPDGVSCGPNPLDSGLSDKSSAKPIQLKLVLVPWKSHELKTFIHVLSGTYVYVWKNFSTVHSSLIWSTETRASFN